MGHMALCLMRETVKSENRLIGIPKKGTKYTPLNITLIIKRMNFLFRFSLVHACIYIYIYTQWVK